MNRRQKIKKHLQEHKTAYITGGVCLLVAGGSYLGYRVGSKRNIEMLANPKINQMLSYKPEATIEVHIEALGDPGNIVQDLTTGVIYASQGQAAREFGVSAPRMSAHLKGEIESLNGHQFVKLGKAHVAA